MAPGQYEYDLFNVTFPSPYVAQVEINRPQKLNAFFEQMWFSLGAIFRKLSHDPEVRVVILTGAGDRAFTSGLDVQAASQNGALAQSPADSDVGRKATGIMRHIQEFQAEISAIEKCEKPVIAVLHGISFGLAIDMTTCCDIRFCSKDTRFSVREVDLGLAADIGTLTRLPYANVSMSWVKDVCLTAREFGADEALKVGYVSGVYDTKAAALDRALEVAKLIATKSPIAVQATKEVINYSRDHSVDDGEQCRLDECSSRQTDGCRSQICTSIECEYAPNSGHERCNACWFAEAEADVRSLVVIHNQILKGKAFSVHMCSHAKYST